MVRTNSFAKVQTHSATETWNPNEIDALKATRGGKA